MPFYIGKGKGYRWMHRGTTNRHARNIINLGGCYCEKYAENLTEVEAFKIERELIAECGREPLGPLVNLTDGGEGISGAIRIFSEQHKINMSISQTGKILSEKTKAKMSAKQKGKTLSEEHKANLRGRIFSKQHRANLALVNLGKKYSETRLANMSASAKREPVIIYTGKRVNLI